VHVELTTSAKFFCGALFDWKLDDAKMAPGFTYTMIGVGEGTGGGMMKAPAPGGARRLAAVRAGR
jgi:predicted enzyme related to lactoylglutathione lyase